VLPREIVEAVVEWARDQDLWILSDEVYEDYVYDGEHTYCRPLAPERTFATHSFSKAYGMAGNRCGYIVGPAERMTELKKVSTHTFYSTPTASQLAALRALEGPGDDWIDSARERYAALGRQAAKRLGVPPPQGSTFLFLDVASRLDERGLEGFLLDCAERGLFLAPGPSFGPYPTHARVCFTSAPPDVVTRGIDVLAEMLGA
jgi:N-succinyldiaminopimelate aminotransferase